MNVECNILNLPFHLDISSIESIELRTDVYWLENQRLI